MSKGNPLEKAIHDTNTAVGNVMSETRKRRNWAYITPEWLKKLSAQMNWPNDEIPDDETCIRRLFGVRLDAPVRKTETMLAVWRKEGEPDMEPNFDSSGTSSDAAVGIG